MAKKNGPKYQYMWYVDSDQLVRFDPDKVSFECFSFSQCKWKDEADLREIFTGDIRVWYLTDAETKVVICTLRKGKGKSATDKVRQIMREFRGE